MAAKPPDGVHVCIQIQYRRCGQPKCRTCKPPSKGHGPYTYGYWREKINGVVKLRSAYMGKVSQTSKN